MRSPQSGSIAQVKTRQIRVWLDSGLRKEKVQALSQWFDY
jgi:hypothetical protein